MRVAHLWPTVIGAMDGHWRTIGRVAGLLGCAVFRLCFSCPSWAEEPKALLSLDLTGCPEGAVLQWAEIPEARRAAGPPNAAVDRFFAGWSAPLSGWMNTPSCLKVVRENGRSVLANLPYGRNGYQSRALIGGKTTWRDYSVEAEVRLVSREPIAAFGECTSLPYVGVIARYQDLNRYYAWVIRPGGPALYRRDNSTWTRLAESQRAIDPARFFRLKLVVSGDELRGFLDDEPLAAVRDNQYCQGKAGVRFNTDIRLGGARVTMDSRQAALAERGEADYQRQWAEARSRYAKPRVFKVLDTAKLVPGLGAPNCYPAHLLSKRQWHLVLTGGGKTVAMDLEGRVLWAAPVSLGNPGFGDPDAAGVSRIACVSGTRMVMLDGRTGRVLAEAPPPPQPLVYGPWRLGNLTGKGQTCYALRTGDNSPEIIVYDDRLREIFRHRVSIEIGHTFALGFWDVDGDGREEILAGGSCLRGDGRPVWQSRISEGHIDQVAFGPFGPRREPRAVFLGIGDGVYFLDGATGQMRASADVGHSQGIAVGNLRPDVPGLESLVFDRWGAFGVTSMFTGDGQVLKQWMLVPEEYYTLHPPVSWLGDGSELILVSRKFAPPTLYDAAGWEIFQLPVEPGYRSPYTHLFPFDVTADSREEILAMERSGKITIFTQDEPPPCGLRLAPAPGKWMLMSLPHAAFSPPAVNLIRNGGFEELDDKGRPVGWQIAGKASLVGPDKAFAGKHSARVRFTDGMWQEVPVKPLVRYELLGMARHELPGVEPGRFKILFEDAQGRIVGSEAPRVFELSPVEYRPFRFEISAPEQAATCRIGVLGRFTGTEWILYDELRFRPMEAVR
jgi:hypothetical protein